MPKALARVQREFAVTAVGSMARAVNGTTGLAVIHIQISKRKFIPFDEGSLNYIVSRSKIITRCLSIGGLPRSPQACMAARYSYIADVLADVDNVGVNRKGDS